MVVCPNCGNSLQARGILLLSNLNAITCQVCSSKLRVKNKAINSAIGGVFGGIGGGLGAAFLYLGLRTGNLLYIGLLITLFAVIFVLSWFLVNRYVKLELDSSKGIIRQTTKK